MNSNAQKNQIARINRRLSKNYRRVCTSKSWQEKHNLGDHYLLDAYNNTVIETHVKLDTLEAESRSAA
jgi:hypothetical protein